MPKRKPACLPVPSFLNFGSRLLLNFGSSQPTSPLTLYPPLRNSRPSGLMNTHMVYIGFPKFPAGFISGYLKKSLISLGGLTLTVVQPVGYFNVPTWIQRSTMAGHFIQNWHFEATRVHLVGKFLKVLRFPLQLDVAH